jgi:hypothetical protein
MAEAGGTDRQKCAHENCKCLIPRSQKFCSVYCAAPDDIETAALQGTDKCKCGHSPCEEAERRARS